MCCKELALKILAQVLAVSTFRQIARPLDSVLCTLNKGYGDKTKSTAWWQHCQGWLRPQRLEPTVPWIDTPSLAAMTPTRRGLAGPGCTGRRSTSSRSPTRRRLRRVCHRQRAGGAVSDRLLSDVVFPGVGAPGGELYARPAPAVLSADGSATRRCVGPQWKGPALAISSHCNFERRFDVACSIRSRYDVY